MSWMGPVIADPHLIFVHDEGREIGGAGPRGARADSLEALELTRGADSVLLRTFPWLDSRHAR